MDVYSCFDIYYLFYYPSHPTYHCFLRIFTINCFLLFSSSRFETLKFYHGAPPDLPVYHFSHNRCRKHRCDCFNLVLVPCHNTLYQVWNWISLRRLVPDACIFPYLLYIFAFATNNRSIRCLFYYVWSFIFIADKDLSCAQFSVQMHWN